MKSVLVSWLVCLAWAASQITADAQSPVEWQFAGQSGDGELAEASVRTDGQTGEVRIHGQGTLMKWIEVRTSNATVNGYPATLPLHGVATASYFVTPINASLPATAEVVVSQDIGSLSADLAFATLRGLAVALGANQCSIQALVGFPGAGAVNEGLILGLLPALLPHFEAVASAVQRGGDLGQIVRALEPAINAALPVVADHVKRVATGCLLEWSITHLAPFLTSLGVPGLGQAMAVLKVAQVAWEVAPDLFAIGATIVSRGLSSTATFTFAFQPPPPPTPTWTPTKAPATPTPTLYVPPTPTATLQPPSSRSVTVIIPEGPDICIQVIVQAEVTISMPGYGASQTVTLSTPCSGAAVTFDGVPVGAYEISGWCSAIASSNVVTCYVPR